MEHVGKSIKRLSDDEIEILADYIYRCLREVETITKEDIKTAIEIVRAWFIVEELDRNHKVQVDVQSKYNGEIFS